MFNSSLRINFIIYFALIAVILNGSCGQEQKTTPVEDPPGTITVYINTAKDATPVVLYDGPTEEADYFYSNGTTYPFDSSMKVKIFLGVDGNINFKIVHHYGDKSNWGWFPDEGGEFADVGKVSSLGEVTAIPEKGWASNVAAIPGHGYVLRYKHSINLDDNRFKMYYARLFVSDYLTSSTSGGVIGIILKYKDPF